MGQKAAEIQQEREQAELQRIAEKRRKEKIADAEARARVKKQIEEDRRARNAKYDEKHEEEMKAKQAELDEIKAQKLREEREKLEEQRRLRDTCARIQFRFHDGSTRTESFGADEPYPSHVISLLKIKSAINLFLEHPSQNDVLLLKKNH